jgi:hypothetical protein
MQVAVPPQPRPNLFRIRTSLPILTFVPRDPSLLDAEGLNACVDAMALLVDLWSRKNGTVAVSFSDLPKGDGGWSSL